MTATKIPAPLDRGGRPPTHPWRTMKVGDYFFVPNRERNTMTSLAGSTGKKLGRKFSTRLCWMIKNRKGWRPCELSGLEHGKVLGIGVWRIE